VEMARYELAPLVLLLDIPEPGPKLEHFLPGVHARHAVYQTAIEDVVADVADEDVRLVKISSMVSDPDGTLSDDGMHLTAEGHRIVGEALADHVLQWLAAQSTSAP